MFSAEKEVFERNIEAEETVKNENPKHIVNDELSFLVQLFAARSKDNYQGVVNNYESSEFQKI